MVRFREIDFSENGSEVKETDDVSERMTLEQASKYMREYNKRFEVRNNTPEHLEIERGAHRFCLSTESNIPQCRSVIDTTTRCMEQFMKTPDSAEQLESTLDIAQEKKSMTIIRTIPEYEIRNLLGLDTSQDLEEIAQNRSDEIIISLYPEMLDQYVQLLLEDHPSVTGEESISPSIRITMDSGIVHEIHNNHHNWTNHVFELVRLRALALVADKGRARLTNQEYSSARGYGSPSVPLDIFMMMMLGLDERSSNQLEELSSEAFYREIDNPLQLGRRLQALRIKALKHVFQYAYQERNKIATSPAFFLQNGRLKTITSLMKTGFYSPPNDYVYHIGTGMTRLKRNVVFRNVDFEHKLQLRAEIGIQEETAYLASDSDIKKLYVFSIDGASNPVVIGSTEKGLVTLSRGKAWGHSTTISAVSDLSGITTTEGTQTTGNDWISTIKLAIGQFESNKWSWQSGRIKTSVMEHLTKNFMTIEDVKSVMENSESNQVSDSTLNALLLRLVGGSVLFDSGNIGLITKRDIQPRSIDCLFLADILAGNDPKLAELQSDAFRQKATDVIENENAMNLLFDFDEKIKHYEGLTRIDTLEDPLSFIFSVFGSHLLHSLQGSVMDGKPLVRYNTKGFSKLDIGSEHEKLCERLRLSQQEIVVQEADLTDTSVGPSPLEQVCLLLSSLKIANEIKKHVDASDSLLELSIKISSTLISHKIGDGIRAEHTKIRNSIASKSSKRYDVFKSILENTPSPDRFNLDRRLRNVHTIPIFGGQKRNLRVIEDIFSNGHLARFVIDNGVDKGPIFLPCDIESHTLFQTVGDNLSIAHPWSNRGKANLLFFLKPKHKLCSLVNNPSKWAQIEKSFKVIEYISEMMIEHVGKYHFNGKSKLSITWDQKYATHSLSEELDYEGAVSQYDTHYDNIISQLNSVLSGSNFSLWDVIDSNKMLSFVKDILLCSKNAVVTDPMGKQGRLHLDSNGMTRRTTDVLSEVATEKFLPMMETISLSWFQKEVIARIEGHSKSILIDARPGSGQDGSMVLYSPEKEDNETWMNLESKTYNITTNSEKQNPAKARDNIIKALDNISKDKTTLVRLSFGEDSAIVILPAINSSSFNSRRIRDTMMTKVLNISNELLGRFEDVARNAGNKAIAKALYSQRWFFAALLGQSVVNVSAKDVEMGVLLALSHDTPLFLSVRSHLQQLDSDKLQQSFNKKTINFFKGLGWI